MVSILPSGLESGCWCVNKALTPLNRVFEPCDHNKRDCHLAVPCMACWLDCKMRCPEQHVVPSMLTESVVQEPQGPVSRKGSRVLVVSDETLDGARLGWRPWPPKHGTDKTPSFPGGGRNNSLGEAPFTPAETAALPSDHVGGTGTVWAVGEPGSDRFIALLLRVCSSEDQGHHTGEHQWKNHSFSSEGDPEVCMRLIKASAYCTNSFSAMKSPCPDTSGWVPGGILGVNQTQWLFFSVTLSPDIPWWS